MVTLVNLKDVVQVYKGDHTSNSCRCGCRGKYWYAEGQEVDATYQKINQKKVQEVVKVLTDNWGRCEFESGIVNLEEMNDSERIKVWTAYTKE